MEDTSAVEEDTKTLSKSLESETLPQVTSSESETLPQVTSLGSKMEDTSAVEEDTKTLSKSLESETLLRVTSSESETLPQVTSSSLSQPSLSSNVCLSFVNSTHDKDASIPSTPTLYENKPMNFTTNQTGNPGLVQITTIHALDKLSKANVPFLGTSKSATFATTSPHVPSIPPVRVVTLQKVASPSLHLNSQPPSPQLLGLTTPPSRTTTPQSPQHVLHLSTNQKGSPCYTKVFQCSPGSQRIGQPQAAGPSNVPTTVTVLRGTGTTILVNGVPATYVTTTMTSPSQSVVNASPSKDPRNKHGQVKRPMNAFMVWARHYRHTLSRQMVHASNSDVSVLLGRIWNNLSDNDKRPFYEEADRLKMQHKITHPGWVYKPHKQRSWDPVTTTASSPNLTGSPITTLYSGSKSTQSTPTKIYHHTTALQSPIIMSPGALTPTASPFKQPGKVSSTSSPQLFSGSSPQLASMPRSPVMRANPISISQSSPQLATMPRSPVMRANPILISQSSPQLATMPRSPVMRANPVSISQNSHQLASMPGSPMLRASPQTKGTIPRTLTAHKPLNSNITCRPNQPVQVIRGSGMVAGSPANIQTASTGMSAQGSITIRNSSGVCQTVPVRIGFRPILRPVIVAPATTLATPLRSSLTSSEQPFANHHHYNFMRTNTLTSTTTSVNSAVGKPSALGRPPSSSLRNIVTMARTTLPVTQTHTTSPSLSVTNRTVCHTPASTKTLVRNESRSTVSKKDKKPPPLLPIYTGTNNCVSTSRMMYQPAFVPITIPQILPQRTPEKPHASVSVMGQKYESVDLQTSVQMSNWSEATKGSVQQSPGQAQAQRTTLGLTKDLKNRVVVSTCPVQQSLGNLKYQTNLTTTIPHQPLTFTLPETNLQNVVYSNSSIQPSLSTNPTYSIHAPIHSPAIISREHSYPRREYQVQGQGQFRTATEDQVKFTPVSSVKKIEPEWWCLPFSPYPLDDILQHAAQGANADARPFARVMNEDNGSGDDGKAWEEANDDVQFFGEATHWQDYCDPYNPAYFASATKQGTELCGNIPSLNMQRWTSYLEGSVTEDKDSILGVPTVVPTNNKSTDIAAQRSVIGDQKTFINKHKGLLEDPVFIQQYPVPGHTQPQLNQIPGQCQFISEGGPLSSFVRGGRTYHVLQQQCSVPSEAAAAQMPQPAATSAGDHLVPAKLCLPPRKKTRQH